MARVENGGVWAGGGVEGEVNAACFGSGAVGFDHVAQPREDGGELWVDLCGAGDAEEVGKPLFEAVNGGDDAVLKVVEVGGVGG